MFSDIIKKIRQVKSLYRLVIYDAQRYYNHCMMKNPYLTQARLLGLIAARQHVVEKGLTMPQPRLGFGKDNIIAMIELCKIYEQKFDKSQEQYQSVIAVLKEYVAYHKTHAYTFDDEFLRKVESLIEKYPEVLPSKQVRITSSKFFSLTDESFPIFARSRHTVRNYSSKDVPLEVLEKVIDLSRTAPSACNRQPIRVHICCGNAKDAVIKVHQGNRGFGHLANKVLVVTSDLSSYIDAKERNCAFVDGGIFVMNLLYALHYYHIGACTLNWSATKADDEKLRQIISLPEEEEVVALICIGMLPEEMSIACAERINTERIISVHK